MAFKNLNYDENSIRILTAAEVNQFDWHRAEILAKEHSQPVEWVKRGFEASRRLGISPDYFVEKYILHNDLPGNSEFEMVFREVLNEVRKKTQNG